MKEIDISAVHPLRRLALIERGGERVHLTSIDLDADLGAKYAILPGDPGRVELIAGFLEDARSLSVHREYTSFLGFVDGEKVLVISTGMGGPSTAICVEELARIGVETVIRVGTCGGMQYEVEGGDVVIPTGAIRQEGTAKEYIYTEFPAVPDFDVVRALDEAAAGLGVRAHKGVVQSKDSYYGQHDPMTMPMGNELKEHYDCWIKAGTLASEMECATLFVVSGLRGLSSGAVLNVIWNKEREEAGLPSETHPDMTDAVGTAVEAIRILIGRARGKTSDRAEPI